MKKIFFFLMILMGSMMLQAQEECTDIIYLSDGQRMIFKCCIDEIKNGNLVYYFKEGKSDTATALAVTVDGKYIDLSRFLKPVITDTASVPAAGLSPIQHGYKYYSDLYDQASKKKTIGTYLTFSGAFLGVTGYILLTSNSTESYKDPLGGFLFVVGALALNVGIPLWISGGIKKDNNRKAMEKIQNINLSLNSSRYGIGLVLRF